MKYFDMPKAELESELSLLRRQYEIYKKKGLKLDMSRGIQSKEQLDLTIDMLSELDSSADCITGSGIDCRNYGQLDGIPEAKKLFSDIMRVPVQNVIVCGNSSLNIMYDTVARAMLFGVCGNEPWSRQGKIRFLCPVPGYDRHFSICSAMGIEMINVPMTAEGPDMDTVERLVSEDASIKGIWCVPKYSNPEGIVYSDETVRRFAALKPKAPDFRIFWDDAYTVHSLSGEYLEQLNLFEEAKKYGNEDIMYIFVSTSKISFPGSGVAAVAASDRNIAQIKSSMSIQTIGHDKLNQLRHVRYFGSLQGVLDHMKKHAALLRPKFKCVLDTFDKEFGGTGIAEWSSPEGGYFISLNLSDGCAQRTYALMNDLGVKLTNAGATFPYGKDPRDSNLRIAPTYPPVGELQDAVNMLCLCAKIACAEKITEK